MLGGLGSALGPLLAGTLIGVSEAVTMAVTAPSWAPIVSFTLLIVILLLRPGRAREHAASARRSCIVARRRSLLAFVPRLGLPAFYDSLLYLMLHWIVLATSWNILSGYTGYFSFGHGAFFGAGMYTTATLLGALRVAVPVDAAGGGARRRAARRRARRGGVPRQRRARRAVRAADAGDHLRHRHDRRQHADRRRPGRLAERCAGAGASGRRSRRPSTCSRSPRRRSRC